MGKEESAKHRRARQADSREDCAERCGGLKKSGSFKGLKVALSGWCSIFGRLDQEGPGGPDWT